MTISILLAFEDPLLRNLLAERLGQESDFTITAAVGDPESLLDAIRLSQPGLVILDLSWSKAVGLALLEQAVLQVPECLYLTLVNSDAEDTQVMAVQSGARGIVTKEDGMAVLPQAIRALTRGEVWFTQQVSRRIFHDYHRLVRHLREQDQPLARLSEREKEVLSCVAEGMKNQEIAERLHMSIHTVKLHVQKILHKLKLPNRTDAAVFAVREGLVSSLPKRIVSDEESE